MGINVHGTCLISENHEHLYLQNILAIRYIHVAIIHYQFLYTHTLHHTHTHTHTAAADSGDSQGHCGQPPCSTGQGAVSITDSTAHLTTNSQRGESIN